MILKILLLSAIFSLSTCQKKDSESTIPTPLKIDTARVSIIKYDSTNLDCKSIFTRGTNAYLNNEDLNKIEFAIDNIINKQNSIEIQNFELISKANPEQTLKKEDFILKKAEYFRRYLVIKNLNGEKEVYVALVCDLIAKNKNFNFKQSLKQGHGGGTCLFSFKLNLETNKYYEVEFNNEA